MAMIWKNLKVGKCPTCSNELKRQIDIWIWGCDVCEFRISDQRRKQIIERLEQDINAKIVEMAEEAGKKEDDYWNDPDIL